MKVDKRLLLEEAQKIRSVGFNIWGHALRAFLWKFYAVCRWNVVTEKGPCTQEREFERHPDTHQVCPRSAWLQVEVYL